MKLVRKKRTNSLKFRKRFGNRPIVLIVLISLVGGLIIIMSHAATPSTNIEAENGAITGGSAGKITGASNSNNGSIKFNKAVASSGWPDATNTGYLHSPDCPNGLTSTWSGATESDGTADIIMSNVTYNCMDFPNGITIGRSGNPETYPSNVTFNGCRFTSNLLNSIPQSQWNSGFDGLVADFGDNITFNYPTFAPKPSLASAPPVAHTKGYQFGVWQAVTGKLTINHADMWGFANGIQIGGSDQTHPFTLTNSWFHDPRTDGSELGLSNTTTPNSDHIDGILENWGDGGRSGPEKYITINHNRILSLDGNTNAIGLQGNTYDHLTVNNNYVSGFNLTVDIGHNLTNSQFIGNVFGNDYHWTHFIGSDGSEFSNQLIGWNTELGVAAANNNLAWCANKYNQVPGGLWTPFPATGSYWWTKDVNYDMPTGAGHTTDDPNYVGTCPSHPIPG